MGGSLNGGFVDRMGGGFLVFMNFRRWSGGVLGFVFLELPDERFKHSRGVGCERVAHDRADFTVEPCEAVAANEAEPAEVRCHRSAAIRGVREMEAERYRVAIGLALEAVSKVHNGMEAFTIWSHGEKDIAVGLAVDVLQECFGGAEHVGVLHEPVGR